MDLSPRISLEISPSSNPLSASEQNIDWDCSLHKENQSSTAAGLSCANLLYPTEPDEHRPKPRVRYQRRNSAVASMLFPAATHASINFPSASQLQSSDSDNARSSLHLSTRMNPIRLTDALKKAQLIVDEMTSYSPPPLENDRLLVKMSKRVSVPWSQKYQEEISPHRESSPLASDATEGGKRKRQKT